MDSSSSTHPNQKWLGFSLSNNQLMSMSMPSSDSSHHHSLFPFLPFNTNSHGGVVDRRGEDGSGATDFVGGSPKLEDFLGASANSASPPPAGLSHFTAGIQTTAVSTGGDHLYDSELKNIAASFLRGFSHDQTHTQKQLAVATPLEPPAKKAVDTFGQRTSIYRGVTRHRWTRRYEAHLWDNSCRREGQSRKGRQVYLGGYDKEEKAARAYDLAALKYWGPTTTTNFPVCNYEKELEDMKNMTRQEFVASLRRKSSGFSRGASIYRGVTRHHQHGRWQARIGRVAGNKDLYLGTFSTQEEAAEAYDIAAIKFRGLNAVTNFDMGRYDIKSIASSNLPVGGMTNKSKTSPDHQSGNSDNKSLDCGSRSDDRDPSTSSSLTTFASQPSTSTLSFALQPIKPDPSDYWSMLAYNQQNTRNPGYNITSGGGLFQGKTLPFSMDFCSASTLNETSNSNNDNNAGLLDGIGGSYIQQQSNGGASSSIAFATPIALNSYNSNYYGGGSGNFGNWIGAAPSLHHSFQLPAKATNVSVFQTPIFSME